jgi:microcystin-dependent protein
VNDPTHAHESGTLGLAGGGGSGFTSGVLAAGGVIVNAAATGISLQSSTAGISIQAAGTGASVVNAQAGGGGAHNNMPPTMIVNYIIRVL